MERTKIRRLKTQSLEPTRTRLQDFVDSPAYPEIVARPGVAALIHEASPMLMDWLVPSNRTSAAEGDEGGVDPIRKLVRNGHEPGHKVELETATVLGLNPMVCPGTSEECSIDLVRVYRVADHVSQKARRRMERVLRRYIRSMDRIARREGKGKVELRVRLNLTEKGPRLAFGLASEYAGTQL